MSQTYFITGISTDVGKTIAAAIVAQALEADYWKPVQAGELNYTDTDKVRQWVQNPKSQFHQSSFALKTPMSPHAAAAIDGVEITLDSIDRPVTSNDLVIEGAGGLLVPLNEKETIREIVKQSDRVILVSRHYLGSINHTLLTVEGLRTRGLNVFGIIFSGDEHPTTESVITKMTGIPVIGRIEEEPYIDEHVVNEYAEQFRDELKRKRS